MFFVIGRLDVADSSLQFFTPLRQELVESYKKLPEYCFKDILDEVTDGCVKIWQSPRIDSQKVPDSTPDQKRNVGHYS